MLEKILSTLDESVFTDSVKQEIYESFEDAVNTKASFIVEEKLQELEEKSEEYLDFLDSKSQEHMNMLSEKSEEHIEFLDSKAEEFVELKEAELLEKLDMYLDRVVEEFVSEAKESLEESVEQAESMVMREAFEAMVSAASSEFQKSLVESANTDIQSEIETLKENFNEAVQEVFELKKANQELLQMGIINEMTEGMTLIESDRFKRLAKGIEFTNDKRYVERLDSIKESVKGFDSVEVETKQKLITESKEQGSYGNLMSFSHLV